MHFVVYEYGLIHCALYFYILGYVNCFRLSRRDMQIFAQPSGNQFQGILFTTFSVLSNNGLMP